MTQNRTIRVILADDHRRIHQIISETLSYVPDIEVVAQASNGREAVEQCRLHNPDVVLMDVVMPIMDGVEATKLILARQPNIKILALSSFREQDTTQAMIQSGAAGFVLKDTNTFDLANAIRTVCEGSIIFSPEIVQNLLHHQSGKPSPTIENITSREQEVLKLMAKGLNNGEIAAKLTISISTVKFHINNLMMKLEVETRAELLVSATKNNLI